MEKFLMAAFHDAKPGEEDAYNEWHGNVHLPEVCQVPGVRSAKRYKVIPASPSVPDAKYLVLYELEVDDPITVLAEFGRRSRDGWSPTPDSADRSKSKIMLFEKLPE